MGWSSGESVLERLHGRGSVVFRSTPAGRKRLTGAAAGTYHGEMQRLPSPAGGIQRHTFLCGTLLRHTLLRRTWWSNTWWLVALLVCWAGLLGGCDEGGKRPVQARVPATNVTPADPSQTASRSAQQAATPQPSLGGVTLPLTNPVPRPNISLLPAVPDSKTYLAQRVEAKFTSGEQNYKAGHLEAARKDFNDAVDWMLESGYDPASSPRLNELFHRLVDTVYSDELQAFRAGDGFSEPPAVNTTSGARESSRVWPS